MPADLSTFVFFSKRGTDISIIQKWAMNSMNLSKEPTYRTIMRIFQDEQNITERIVRGDTKGRKASILSDRLIKEKASRVQCE